MNEFSPYLLPLLFLIKLGVGCFFLYVYTYVYGGGLLTHDAGEFLRESKLLHDVYLQSPKDYFIFLFGLEPDTSFVLKYLSNTHHWSAHGKPFFNDSQNVIRFNSLVYFISKGWDFTHVLVGSIFSFLALLITYNWVKLKSSLSKKTVLLLLFTLPSLLFWSSSFLKEPFMILGIALFCYGIFNEYSSTLKRITYVIGGSLLALLFKPYVFILLLIALLFYALYHMLKQYSITMKLSLFVILVSLVFSLPKVHNSALNKITRQQTNFINVGAGGMHIARNDSILFFTTRDVEGLRLENNKAYIDKDLECFYVTDNIRYTSIPYQAQQSPQPYMILYQSEGSASHFELTRLNYSMVRLFKSAPEALLNSFLRPFWSDEGSWLMTLAKLENIFLVILTVFFLYKGRFKNNTNLPIIITFAIFIFAIMLIIGYTTPVTGAIVRYKIPALLALGIMIILSFNTKKET